MTTFAERQLTIIDPKDTYPIKYPRGANGKSLRGQPGYPKGLKCTKEGKLVRKCWYCGNYYRNSIQNFKRQYLNPFLRGPITSLMCNYCYKEEISERLKRNSMYSCLVGHHIYLILLFENNEFISVWKWRKQADRALEILALEYEPAFTVKGYSEMFYIRKEIIPEQYSTIKDPS